MKSILSFVLVIILCLGQSATAQDELPIELDVDYASFAYADSASLVEIYLGFDLTSLQFARDSSGFRARLPVQLRITQSSSWVEADSTAETVWREPVDLQFALADTSSLEAGLHFVHQVRATIPPGKYELHVAIPEDSSEQRYQEMTVRRGLLVTDYTSADEPMLSDLQLASEIKQDAAEGGPFYKHGLAIRPNVNQFYGAGLGQLLYFAESYRADEVSEGDEYTVLSYISRGDGQQSISDLERTVVRRARTPDVIIGSFDVSTLPSGSYFLRMALLDQDSTAVIEQAKKFFVYNPEVGGNETRLADQQFESSPYAQISEEGVERELQQIRYVATDQEQRRIKRLKTMESKRRFLMSFWQKRDSNPHTSANEGREEFQRMVSYVNERYGNQISEGWETDRGRVLLKYGRPAQIEPHLFDHNTHPFVVWQYDNISGEGRSIFVFADREGFGDFKLIHSSVAGELTMPNWQQIVVQ